eukprot:GFYU01000636.1.p1 GENE.GFYU01000636.1~~GFYU01000636.1.p1  ORF type:complete len:108 (-),score=22.26 GFYU01000636.1:19-342(-)
MVTGVELIGAKCDPKTGELQETDEPLRRDSLPLLWLRPKTDDDEAKFAAGKYYMCPVYRSLACVANPAKHDLLFHIPFLVSPGEVDSDQWTKRCVVASVKCGELKTE